MPAAAAVETIPPPPFRECRSFDLFSLSCIQSVFFFFLIQFEKRDTSIFGGGARTSKKVMMS